MEREAEIIIKVKLDENNLPVKISWQATDSGTVVPQNTSAFMLSVWDGETKNTLGIDLWTDKMLVDDMKIYFFQTLFKMSHTFERATNNKEAGKMIKKFADEFAEYLNKKRD